MKNNSYIIIRILVLSIIIVSAAVVVKMNQVNTNDEKILSIRNNYSLIDINSSFEGLESVESNGWYMFALYNNQKGSVECPSDSFLKNYGVKKYSNTSAPYGEIIFYDQKWYVANILKRFSNKNAVKRHINNCLPVLINKMKYIDKNETENLKSWLN